VIRPAERLLDPTPSGEFGWAGQLAERLLEPLGRRWRHTVGVVARAQSVIHLLDQHEAEVVVAAAYLHDIGYAPELRDTRFHPLDGARFLRGGGHERLARLVAYHTGALVEAEERGVETELAEFCEERSLVAKLLTYCDLTTSADGDAITAVARLSDIVERYGDAELARAARRSTRVLLAEVSEIESLLAPKRVL
jgi:predicted hydrolase (HD superfamily)